MFLKIVKIFNYKNSKDHSEYKNDIIIIFKYMYELINEKYRLSYSFKTDLRLDMAKVKSANLQTQFSSN